MSGLLPTGITGLDEILHGGLPTGELYLMRGRAGTGKTLISVCMLRHAAAQGRRALLVTLSQRRASLEQLCVSHDWPAAPFEICEVQVTAPRERMASHQVVFESQLFELADTMQEIVRVIDERDPEVVVVDAISHLRLMADSDVIYRQQLVALRDYFADRGTTVLLTENSEIESISTNATEAMAHGVIELHMEPTLLGHEHRWLRVIKVRNHHYVDGLHDFEIRTGAVRVQPRLELGVPADLPDPVEITSGVTGLDELVGGGLLTGTACLLVGPSGTGKTSMATLYTRAALDRGLCATVALFDELPGSMLARARALGMALDEEVGNERLRIHHIPARVHTMGSFCQLVRRDVEQHGARVVVLDTLTGFLSAIPERQRQLPLLHELLTWLRQRGVLTLLVVAQRDPSQPANGHQVNVTYLADAVLLLRRFESHGHIGQAIMVYKKRFGSHGSGVHQLTIDGSGIRVGPAIQDTAMHDPGDARGAE